MRSLLLLSAAVVLAACSDRNDATAPAPWPPGPTNGIIGVLKAPPATRRPTACCYVPGGGAVGDTAVKTSEAGTAFPPGPNWH
ncbi:hypothetical protein J421_4312 [Gemmatirosa kalamazoonensis]|uniref:Lipoprotein n=1 Tax=Gemmatirosa kalamazoonensis TaxID=861299 RepID=W0RL92_9BACT|nr:hypothetical protein [Gemmatirosa kalamazoonensis]AHG91849.1 hypothetical protein J421_4312 [Gemmatirosa kalamazoonensis]